MQQVTVQLGNLPIGVVFLSNHHIGFILKQGIPVIIENLSEGVIDTEGIHIGDETYEYGIMYEKNSPGLVDWLKKQELIYPRFEE